MKILVVDDDSIITDMLESLLTDWGYEPLVFNRGIDAQAALIQDNTIRLAILDWNLPIVSGLHICQSIRKKSGEKVYVIMLTSNGSIQHVRQALEAGVNNYIVKPFEPNDLKTRIEAGVRAIELQSNNGQSQARAA
jgi:DNA-binding response OmpR family regulator